MSVFGHITLPISTDSAVEVLMPDFASLSFSDLRPTFEGTLGAARPPSPPAIPEAEASRLVALVQRLQRALPLLRLSVLARVYESDEVLARLPLMCRAMLTVDTVDQIDGNRVTLTQTTTVVGSLATDHTGYASFDLRPLAATDHLFALAAQVPDSVEADTVEATLDLCVLPFADPLFEIDALDRGDISHDAVVLPVTIDAVWLRDRAPDLALPSLQNPGLDDWRLSPGSFALSPERTIGDGACEDLLPSDLSTQQFKFAHVVRLIDKALEPPDTRTVSQVRYGYQMLFENRWFPIGHSLGQVLYSLPLAPGETVNLAITDWSRTDTASRNERTQLDEAIEGDSQRDRTITEVVRGVLSEVQEGSSVMGGLSANALIPLGNVLIGGALGIGGSSSDSSGLRNVSTDMTQRLNDSFRQSSSAVRQLRSTVITHAAQAESGSFETRSITNHNHCHTLTVLYYEVLRHYRIVTEQTEARPVLLLSLNRGTAPNLGSEHDVLANRAALEAALLDRRHLRGFEALMEARAARKRLTDAEQKFNAGGGAANHSGEQFSSFLALFKTGQKGSDSDIFLSLLRTDGLRIACRQIDPPPTSDAGDLDAANSDDFEAGTLTAFEVVPASAVSWGDISGFVVRHQRRADQAATAAANPNLTFDFSWDLEQVRIIGRTLSQKTELVLDRAVGLSLMDSETPVLPVIEPVENLALVPPKLTDFIPAERLVQGEALLEHLAEFADYYLLATLYSGDPVKRATAIGDVTLRPGVSLFDVIEPRPVGHIGGEVAFRLTDVGDRVMRDVFDMGDEDRPPAVRITKEELLSLPTRGVFADGKIGHCSTCEVIDDTRFWDFQTSPLPNKAPDIAPVDTSSRFQMPTGTSPTGFPSSILNFVNPTPAPDPTGTDAALKALATANIFRDMSGTKELSDFLSNLTQGNADALTKFADLQQKKAETDLKPKLIDQIKNLDDLSADQKSDLIGRVLGGDGGAGSSNQPNAPSAEEHDVKPSTVDATPERKAPKPPPRSARKPTRPAPKPASGTLHMLIDLEPKGVFDPSKVSLSLDILPIDPPQPIYVGPVSPGTSFLRAELPALTIPEGQVRLRMSWTVVRDYTDEARAWIRAQRFIEGDPNWSVPLPVRTGTEVSITTDTTFKYENGARVITLIAEPILASSKFKDTSFSSAELNISTELGFKVVPLTTTVSLTGKTVDSATRERQYEVIGMRELQLKQE